MMKLTVFACLLAVAFASPYAGLAYGTFPYAYGAPYAYSAAPYYGGWLNAPNYRGPLSLAPGQPAEVLGADGRPLDTLEVNLDRAAHLTAKAAGGFHLLKKRSVVVGPLPAPIVAPIAAPIATRIATPLITPATPISYSAPIAAAAFGYGPTYARYL